jgi:hypothetical protein
MLLFLGRFLISALTQFREKAMSSRLRRFVVIVASCALSMGTFGAARADTISSDTSGLGVSLVPFFLGYPDNDSRRGALGPPDDELV